MSLLRNAARPVLVWTAGCTIFAVWVIASAYAASGDELPVMCNPDCRWNGDIAWVFGWYGLAILGRVWVIVALLIALAVWIRSGNS